MPRGDQYHTEYVSGRTLYLCDFEEGKTMILCVYNVNDTDLSVKKSNCYYCSVILYNRAFMFKNEE